MVSYRALLHIAEAAVHGPIDSRLRSDLLHALESSKDDFRDLLAHTPRRAEDRAQVLSKEVQLPDSPSTILDDQDVQIVLKLSADLNLNEVDCVALLVATHQEWSIEGRDPLEVVRLAAGLWMTERRSLLTVLHMLLQVVVLQGELNPGLAAAIGQYIQELMESGLRSRLLILMRELNREEPAGLGGPGTEPYVMDIRGSLVLRQNVVQRERRLLAQCLVYSGLIMRINSSEAVDIFNLLKDCAADWSHHQDPVKLQISYTILFSLVNALVSDSLGGALDAPPVLAPDASFRKQFQLLIMSKTAAAPPVDNFVAIVKLAWAVFLSNTKEFAPIGTGADDDAAARACLETSSLQAALKFLTCDILGSPTYQNTDSDLVYLFTAYLHKLLCCFLTQPLGRDVVQVIKDEAVNAADPWLDEASLDALQDQPGQGSETRQRFDTFIALLKLVGDVYSREPELMIENAALWTFVLYAGEEHRGYATMAAFLDLLTALATGAEGARQVYRLLQERAFKVISWETLFHTLIVYDQQFRQSMQTTGAVLHPFPSGDARALEAYLRTMRKVMEEGAEDERVTWFPSIEPLFRLLQYEVVPMKLKGALRDVIRAFVPLGPEVSDSIWSLLDTYDLPVMPQAPTGSSGFQQLYDMSYELNEVEARAEEFPSTISYVLLLNALISADAPQADQGWRYSKYFKFVRDQVFLPYGQRAYASTSEKWQLVAASLANFEMMLTAYQPEVELQEREDRLTARPPSTVAAGAEPPGQELMKDFMSGRAVYRNVLGILALGADAALEERATQQHGIYLEDAVRLSFRLLILVLSKDAALVDKWQPSCQPLESVLRTDSRLLVTVLEFVRYDALPEIQRASVQLMAILSSRLQQLVPIILEEGAAARLTDDYAACLEAQLQEAQPAESFNQDTGYLIMQLLLGSLDRPKLNVAHMLLGFELDQPIERTSLQPRRSFSCLRVLLDLVEQRRDPEGNARVYEMAYELLYALCTDPVTGVPTTELLRSPRYNFFAHHVEGVACQPLSKRSSNQALRISSLQQRAWLLKLLAFAIHVADTDVHQQREGCQRLLTLLFEPGTLRGGDEDDARAIVVHEASAQEQQSTSKPLILELLDLLLFQLHGCEPQASAEVQAFQQDLKVSNLVEIPATVEEGGIYTISERGDRIIDIEAFKEALLQEYKKVELAGMLAGPVSGSGGTSGSQVVADKMREAVQASLKWAWSLNWHQQEAAAQLHLLLAWCQLVEIAFSRRFELLDARRRSQMLFGILDASLEAMDSADCSPPMGFALSQVVMTLVAKLQEQSLAVPLNGETSDDVTWVDLLTRARLPNSACHAILSGLVRALLRHETSEALRKRLYATLVCYLNYSRGAAKWELPPSVLRASLLDGVAVDEDLEIEKVEREQAELVEGNYVILKREAAALVDLVARDAAHGSELGRALAYSVLGALVAEDAEQPVFMSQLQSRGLLQACLADLSTDSYQAVLLPSAEAMRKLYLVATELSLLLRVSHQQRPRGAATLFSMGALRAAAQCRALDVSAGDAQLEDLAAAVATGTSVPPQRDRHHQVVAPLLRLVLAVTALVDNATAPSMKGQDEVVAQACHFIHIHEALFSRILLDVSATPRLENLEELELAMAILSRVWTRESISERSKLEELIFHLALTYFVPDPESRVKYVRHLRELERAADVAPEARMEAGAMEESLWRVRGHIVCYLYDLVSKHSILFSAVRAKESRGRSIIGAVRHPTLKLLADFLRQSTFSLCQAAEDKAVVLNKIEDLNELPRHEVEDLVKAYGRRPVPTSSGSTRSRRYLAMVAMGQFITSKEKQITSLRYIVEHVLMILLIHYQALPQASTGFSTSGTAPRLNQGEVADEPSGLDAASLGSKDDMEEIGRRLSPLLDRLDSITEEKIGRNVEHMKRLVQLLKGHIFSTSPGAFD